MPRSRIGAEQFGKTRDDLGGKRDGGNWRRRNRRKVTDCRCLDISPGRSGILESLRGIGLCGAIQEASKRGPAHFVDASPVQTTVLVPLGAEGEWVAFEQDMEECCSEREQIVARHNR